MILTGQVKDRDEGFSNDMLDSVQDSEEEEHVNGDQTVLRKGEGRGEKEIMETFYAQTKGKLIPRSRYERINSVTTVERGPHSGASSVTTVERGPHSGASSVTTVERGPHSEASRVTTVEKGPDSGASRVTTVEKGPHSKASRVTTIEKGPHSRASSVTTVERGPHSGASRPTGAGSVLSSIHQIPAADSVSTHANKLRTVDAFPVSSNVDDFESIMSACSRLSLDEQQLLREALDTISKTTDEQHLGLHTSQVNRCLATTSNSNRGEATKKETKSNDLFNNESFNNKSTKFERISLSDITLNISDSTNTREQLNDDTIEKVALTLNTILSKFEEILNDYKQVRKFQQEIESRVEVGQEKRDKSITEHLRSEADDESRESSPTHVVQSPQHLIIGRQRNSLEHQRRLLNLSAITMNEPTLDSQIHLRVRRQVGPPTMPMVLPGGRMPKDITPEMRAILENYKEWRQTNGYGKNTARWG